MRTVWLGMITALTGCGPPPPPMLVVSRPVPNLPFCTRTLGVAECFSDPYALPDRPSGLGDVPVRTHRLPAPSWRLLD